MKDEYDFSQSVKNPYAQKLKQHVTVQLDEETIRYFKILAAQTGISYQNLINLYLKDCVSTRRTLSRKWVL